MVKKILTPDIVDRFCTMPVDGDNRFPPVKWREGADSDDVVDDPSDWINHEFVMVRLELFDIIGQLAEQTGTDPANFILDAIRQKLMGMAAPDRMERMNKIGPDVLTQDLYQQQLGSMFLDIQEVMGDMVQLEEQMGMLRQALKRKEDAMSEFSQEAEPLIGTEEGHKLLMSYRMGGLVADLTG